jgi:hypothetical protein
MKLIIKKDVDSIADVTRVKGNKNSRTFPINLPNNASFKDSPFKPISLDVNQKKYFL